MDILQVLWTFGVIIIEFIVEYCVFLALFLHNRSKRDKFVLRCVLCVVAYLLFGLSASWFYTAFGNTIWGRIIVYTLLFVVSTGLLKLCFAESYFTVLFCCGMAYAAQNLSYKLFLVFWTFGEMLGAYDSWGTMFNLYYRLFYYIFLAACYTALWFLFIRGIVRRLVTHDIDTRMLVITGVVLAVTVVLCSFEDVYFAKLCVERENKFDNPVYYVLRQTGNLFSVASCATALLLSSKAIVERGLRREVEYLKHAVRQGELQYEISKDTIDLVNIKCHDIKYKLGALAAGGKLRSEAVDDLRESISIYDSRISTGNKLLDVLFTEKSLFCEQNKIMLSCMINGEKLEFIDDGDLYCLFGNLIDNALEAARVIGSDERRVINIMVKTMGDMILVQEENYFDGVIEFRDGLPVTTKDDKAYHGFGMRSIAMIVKKYGGELTSYVTDDIFHLNIIFPTRGAEHGAKHTK